MQSIHIDPKQAAPIIRATFPGYTGKMCAIRPATSVCFQNLNWSGGTRNTYRACKLDGTPLAGGQDLNTPPPWSNPAEGKSIEIPRGHAVVEHTIFCGKDLGLRIYAHPDDVAPMLPAPVDLSPFEALVLKYTCERKSSYNGQDRYAMALSDTRYAFLPNRQEAPAFPTRPEWDAAKATLIARGLLNKAGAVTIAGRNAHKG